MQDSTREDSPQAYDWSGDSPREHDTPECIPLKGRPSVGDSSPENTPPRETWYTTLNEDGSLASAYRSRQLLAPAYVYHDSMDGEVRKDMDDGNIEDKQILLV